jgi:phosphatidylinositol alpha-1,6-mannosyltransferase
VSSAFTKVLIISSEFPPNVGGIGNHAYNLAKSLAAEGFEVTVVADIIDVTNKELEIFAAEQSFKIHWLQRKSIVVQTYFARLTKALSLCVSADKIICSGKFSLWTAILIRVKYPRKELTAVVHGTELDLQSKAPKKLTSYALSKFDKIISVSQYTQRFLPKSLLPHINRFIIHNGINGSEFCITASSSLDGEPALITVGNVTDRKGQENVINALPQILEKHASAVYHIVGKPTNKEKIEKRAKAVTVEKSIRFYGALSRQELLQKLKGAKIKLMLSNHTAEGDFEGFGIAVLEANAFGIPAIGSRDSGIADAIEHGKTGLLVDQYNAKEVAEAVTTILNDYPRFSANAKEWAVQHDLNIIVKKYIEVLNA